MLGSLSVGLLDEAKLEDCLESSKEDWKMDGDSLEWSIQELLNTHLAMVQRILESNHRQASRFAAHQVQIRARQEEEVLELRNENERLKEMLSGQGLAMESSSRLETGGTGEASSLKADRFGRGSPFKSPSSGNVSRIASGRTEGWGATPKASGSSQVAADTGRQPEPRHGRCFEEAGTAPPAHAAGDSGRQPEARSARSFEESVAQDANAVSKTGAEPQRVVENAWDIPGAVAVQNEGAVSSSGACAVSSSQGVGRGGAHGAARPVQEDVFHDKVTPVVGSSDELAEDVTEPFVVQPPKQLLKQVMPPDGEPVRVDSDVHLAAVVPAPSPSQPVKAEKLEKPDSRGQDGGHRRSRRNRDRTVSGEYSNRDDGELQRNVSNPTLDGKESGDGVHEKKKRSKSGHGHGAKRHILAHRLGMMHASEGEAPEDETTGKTKRQSQIQQPFSSGPKAVFADGEELKKKLRENIGKPEYNVANFYHEHGFWPAIARNHIFENCTLAVIGMNAIWISIDTDHNKAALLLDAEPIFQIVELGFFFYFCFEWFSRFMAFKHKSDGLKDSWFVFDTILVMMMVFETVGMNGMALMLGGGSGGGLAGNTGILKILRLVRLSRMARMARLLRAMPELMIMIKGMSVAMRSVFFTLCLLACIIYVFSIAFTQLLTETDVGSEKFYSVPVSMNTLLLDGTLPDHESIVADVAKEDVFASIMMLIYILLASLTVMNMLIGVLCEVVSVVSAVEKEELLVNFVKSQLMTMMRTTGLDANNDNRIAKTEFESLLEKPDAARALQEVGVDVVGLVDFTDFIFEGDRELSFSEFMDVVLQLRGSNTATVKDIVDLRKLVSNELKSLDEKNQERLLELADRLNCSDSVSAYNVERSECGNAVPDSFAFQEADLSDCSH